MFDELPTELVERILTLLSYEEKVAVLGVCKRYMNKSLFDQDLSKMENNTSARNRTTSTRCHCGGGEMNLKILSFPSLICFPFKNEEFIADFRWRPDCDHDYLVGQYVLLPRRLGGHPVYQQAETVGKENYFLFRDSSMWQFSHILGASDGRYPRINQTQDCRRKSGETRKLCSKFSFHQNSTLVRRW